MSQPMPHTTPAGEGFQAQTLNRLFDQLIQLTTWSCAAYMAIILLIGGEWSRLFAPTLIGLGGPACNVLRKRYSDRLGFSVYVWSIWIAIMVQSGYRGGIVNPILHGCIILVLMGGWLLGMRQALFLLMASISWITVLAFVAGKGEWTPIPNAIDGGYWLPMASVWVVGYLVLRQVYAVHQSSMAEIKALNMHLEQKVDELARQESATRTNEQKVMQLLNASPLPITVASFASGVYVDVNPAWERFFQFSKTDVMGKTSVELGFWQDIRQRQGWIDTFSAEGRVSGHEVNYLMRDGTQRVFLLSSERFFYGDEDCVLTMSVDVTDRKRMESELKMLNTDLELRVTERTQALDQSNRELLATMDTLKRTQDELINSEKLASLGSLVAGVAHELNTPLGNALVSTSTVTHDIEEMQQRLGEGTLKKSAFENFMLRMKEGTQLTLRSLERAVSLIASFKQVAVDQDSERRRTFDLAQTLNEVLDTLRPGIKRSRLQLEVSLCDGVSIDSFPGPLGQVVINLITNAVNHGFDGLETGTIRITALRQSDSTVSVSIEDDGVGIPTEHLGQIFDPFFTTKLGSGGSGLGLSISHRITTKVLGGQVTVHSVPGRGARFDLVLP
ncbi:MAG: PAS domain-containing sensor histidine kinase, partial [Rhodoferax sp.]|nr:PAS domain-containing sensor histidine kinase [Rhodoferax sp.]